MNNWSRSIEALRTCIPIPIFHPINNPLEISTKNCSILSLGSAFETSPLTPSSLTIRYNRATFCRDRWGIAICWVLWPHWQSRNIESRMFFPKLPWIPTDSTWPGSCITECCRRWSLTTISPWETERLALRNFQPKRRYGWPCYKNVGLNYMAPMPTSSAACRMKSYMPFRARLSSTDRSAAPKRSRRHCGSKW